MPAKPVRGREEDDSRVSPQAFIPCSLPGYSISTRTAFAHSIGNRRYRIADLRELLTKATPLRSGDVLAGLAAGSAEERVAAQYALADLPLGHFLLEQVVPCEQDEYSSCPPHRGSFMF